MIMKIHILLIANSVSQQVVDNLEKSILKHSCFTFEFFPILDLQEDTEFIKKIILEKENNIVLIGVNQGCILSRYFNAVWDIPSVCINPPFIEEIADKHIQFLLDTTNRYLQLGHRYRSCVLMTQATIQNLPEWRKLISTYKYAEYYTLFGDSIKDNENQIIESISHLQEYIIRPDFS